MSYFNNVKSLDDLKDQFRALVKQHHPDAGGDTATMQKINAEYDELFPIWRARYNAAAAYPTNETADSTRSEFYTEFGWKGKNHSWSRSTKEVAAIIRAYVKEIYPTYRFSVRFSQASMCSEIHVELKEAPADIYKPYEDLTDDERMKVWHVAELNYWVPNTGYLDDKVEAKLKEAYRKHHFLKKYTESVQAMLDDIDSTVKSYNYEDCDGTIDYFHVDFYWFGVKVSDKLQIVPRTPRIKGHSGEVTTRQETPQEATQALPDAPKEEYDIQKTTHTKTGETIYTVKVIRKLSRDEYMKMAEFMRSIGGYYSKYVHAFVFKTDPSEALAAA